MAQTLIWYSAEPGGSWALRPSRSLVAFADSIVYDFIENAVASVELPELTASGWLGSNPPMICPKVESPGVSSTIVTQVVLP